MRYYEDFIVGSVVGHLESKTVLESDNNIFCLLTMNHNPLHLNVEYAKSSQHGRIVVVGTYVFSLVVGMTVRDISNYAIANLGYHEIIHHLPVFIGDTITAETEIISKRESRTKPDRGIVLVEARAFNQKNDKVLSFRREIMVKKK